LVNEGKVASRSDALLAGPCVLPALAALVSPRTCFLEESDDELATDWVTEISWEIT